MKKIFSLVLIICVVGAWGSIISKNINIPKEYEEYLSDAKDAISKEYYLEALNYANSAVSVDGIESTYEAEIIKRDSYRGLGDWKQFEWQCRTMIANYPDVEENYEALVQRYLDAEDIPSLSGCVFSYSEKWPENETILKAKELVDTSYSFVRRGYYDVVYASPTIVNIQIHENEIVDEETIVRRELVNQKGNTIFRKNYVQIVVSQDGTSYFVCEQDGTWKRVNTSNYLLAKNEEFAFESIGALAPNGLATAVVNGEYRFINGEMKVSEYAWEYAGTFYNNLNGVKKNGKWALVSSNNWGGVTEFPYADIPFNSQNHCAIDGFCVVADASGYKILETEGFIPVSENVYEELKAFESNQPTAYRKGDKWGFVDTNGNVYIEAVYEDAKPFMNGYAAVKQNGLWGYINMENKMVVEPQFQDALAVLSSGYAYVKAETGYWDYIIIDKLYYTN